MSTTQIVPASEASHAALHATMLDAFSDYAIPMQLSLDQFTQMMQQRGLDLPSSRIALVEGQVAAIWLTARRGTRSYLISSGTRPAFRSRGLGRAMATQSLAYLREAGARSFQTEVLRNNDTALGLYLSLGMHKHRQLDCYGLTATVARGETRFEPVPWEEIASQTADLRDWSPSWQNEAQSLSASSDHLLCLSHVEGSRLTAFAAVQRSTGTFQQIAVHPDARRRGIATALVAEAQHHLPEMALRFINICSTDAAFRAFLGRIGATEMIGQFELKMSL